MSSSSLAGFPRRGGGLRDHDERRPEPRRATRTTIREADSTTNSTDTGRGDDVYDSSVLSIPITVPAGSNCVSFEFRFLSEEYPEYVDSSYNDAFIAELDNNTWSATGSDINAPNNFATDELGNEVSINATGNATVSAVNSAGTTYDASTQRLRTEVDAAPGAHTLFLSMFDQGDGILDSAAFIDNVVIGNDPDCGGSVAAAGAAPSTPPITGSTSSTGATFNFGDPPPGGHFICQIHEGPASDENKGEPYDLCSSPYAISFGGISRSNNRLAEGVNTLSVSAVNSTGDADQTPSVFEFVATAPSGGGAPAVNPPAAQPAPKAAAKKCKKKKSKKASAAAKCKKKKKK